MQCNRTTFLAGELDDAFSPFQAVGSALTQVELVVDGVEVGAQTKCRRCTALHSINKKMSFMTVIYCCTPFTVGCQMHCDRTTFLLGELDDTFSPFPQFLSPERKQSLHSNDYIFHLIQKTSCQQIM